MTSYASLERVESGRVIVIDETYVYEENGWYYGLVKGNYVASAKDRNGVFYLGPNHSVVILYSTFGIEYRKTGKLPTVQEKLECCHGPWFGDTGGVWIPYDLSKHKPKFFLIADHSDPGTESVASANLAIGGPIAIGAGYPARSYMQGKLVWGREINDKKLLAELAVTDAN